MSEEQQISASEYVHRVYADAVAALPDAQFKWGKPAMDVYEFIRLISPSTNDRLIELGAHQASGRIWKTAYFFDYQLGISTVPSSWYTEWSKAFSVSTAGLQMKSAGDQLFDYVAPKVQSGFESLFLGGIILYVVMDAYSETKAGIKQRVESA